jgi:hypothetical protein
MKALFLKNLMLKKVDGILLLLLLLVPPSILFWSWVSPLTTKLRDGILSPHPDHLFE